MGQQLELFELSKDITMTPENTAVMPQPMPKKGYFVTNHQNLLMYLMMNVITSLTPLGKKSYQDSLSFKAGYTPIFSTKPPKWALEMSTEERSDLIPVIIEVDLSQYQGQLVINCTSDTTHNSEWQSIPAAQVVTSDNVSRADIDWTMLLLAEPLATKSIRAIKLPNKEGIKKVKDKVLDTNGVDIDLYRLTTDTALFKFNKTQAASFAPSIGISTDTVMINYNFADAITAVYATVNLLANVNEQALHALLLLLQKPEPDIKLPILDDIVADFCHWVISPNMDTYTKAGRLYIDMVEIIIASSNVSQAKKSIIELLQSQIDPAGAQTESQQFINDLSSMLGLKDKSFDTLKSTYTKSFHRMLLTFFHTDGIERFLASDGADLSDSESVLAMIMIAASTGWSKLPVTIKNYASMHTDISLLLVDLCSAHLPDPDIISTSISQAALDNLPLPVRYYLKQSWRKPSRQAAKVLIKDKNWSCLDYEISLPNGQYDIKTTDRFLKFKSKQPIKVEEVIDQDEFLDLMQGLDNIDAKIEQLMRRELGI